MAFASEHLDFTVHKHHTSGDSYWGSDLGDGSPEAILRAGYAARERELVDRESDRRIEERFARVRAWAARRQSARREKELLREQLGKAASKGTRNGRSLGAALAEALALSPEQDGLRPFFPARESRQRQEETAPRRDSSRLKACFH